MMINIKASEINYEEISIKCPPKNIKFANELGRILYENIETFQKRIGSYPDLPVKIVIAEDNEEYVHFTSKNKGIIQFSEAVYNFQRIFNLRMGFGRREHDNIPYRAVGPVTIDEYESRHDRYDRELIEKYDVDITGKGTEEKVTLLRKVREDKYERLKDAVYKRRGWTQNGIPTIETVKRLGIDFPDVLDLLKE